MDPISTTTAETQRPLFRSPRRIMLATLGILCVGLAGVGVVVPGLPTTIFLIAASYLFTKSCPVLEQVLIRNRFFGPFLKYLDGSTVMPAAVVRRTLLVMWACVAVSAALLIARDAAIWLPPTVVLLAAVGHVFIIRCGRPR